MILLVKMLSSFPKTDLISSHCRVFQDVAMVVLLRWYGRRKNCVRQVLQWGRHCDGKVVRSMRKWWWTMAKKGGDDDARCQHRGKIGLVGFNGTVNIPFGKSNVKMGRSMEIWTVAGWWYCGIAARRLQTDGLPHCNDVVSANHQLDLTLSLAKKSLGVGVCEISCIIVLNFRNNVTAQQFLFGRTAGRDLQGY